MPSWPTTRPTRSPGSWIGCWPRRRYGERWGRHWLDVVRYADARDLIQLPAASDFREAWRYRDWVVEAFNRDLPYADFVRHQIAGDLLPPPRPGGINKDGLVATGLLAIADFVPGDVDKDQMIADYVNDQIDVVGRAFLGLTVACARCHDHKFDPISAEDYYALAGIFFSTRLIPGPVPGNTPLVRVPLLSPDELARDARGRADKQRRAELEQQLPDAADREYLSLLKPVVIGQTARYLVAACEYRNERRAGEALPGGMGEAAPAPAELAGRVGGLSRRVEKDPPASRPAALRDAAAGKLAGSRSSAPPAGCNKPSPRWPPEGRPSRRKSRPWPAPLLCLRADDPHLRHRLRRPGHPLAEPFRRCPPMPNRRPAPAAP